MDAKTLRYATAAVTAFIGILHLYANVQYGLFSTLNVPISQGGGWPYPAFFTIDGLGFLVGAVLVFKGLRWSYYLGIVYLIVDYTLYLTGAYGTIFPASPFGVEPYGIFTEVVHTVLLVLLVMLLKQKTSA